MQRLFVETLEKWRDKKKQNPLLVIGARQVGKTYIIDKFCKQNYKNYSYVNLMKDKDLIQIFEENTSFETKVDKLEVVLGHRFDEPDSILFVDEVQESELFIESLKFFCESERNFHIICAGSLLGVKLSRFHASFPVGKVDMEYLYPMNFEEFLMAIGKERYIPLIKECFDKNKSLGAIHKVLLNDFYTFLYLGGMPEVIQSYIDGSQSLVNVDTKIIKNIVESYFNDMTKYNTDKKEFLRIQEIYQNIPSQLAKENQKFVFAKIAHNARKTDYITALDWLVASNIVLMNKQVTIPEFPLLGFVDNESYKLFLSDTGILSYLVQITPKTIIMDGDYSYKGIMAENFVATELLKKNIPLTYWSRKGTNKGNAEIDFLIQIENNIIPIEVKAGTETKSKRLKIYVDKFHPKYSIRLSTKDFGFENNIKSVPIYATFLISTLK